MRQRSRILGEADDTPKNRDGRQRGGSSEKTREGEGSKELQRSARAEDRDGSRQTKGERGEGGRERLNPYEMAGRVGREKYIKGRGEMVDSYLSRPFG